MKKVDAAHTGGIGLQPDAEKHVKPGKDLREMERHAGYTDLASSRSNRRIEKKIDRSIYKVAKETYDQNLSDETIQDKVVQNVLDQCKGKQLCDTDLKNLEYFKEAHRGLKKKHSMKKKGGG